MSFAGWNAKDEELMQQVSVDQDSADQSREEDTQPKFTVPFPSAAPRSRSSADAEMARLCAAKVLKWRNRFHSMELEVRRPPAERYGT